MNAARENTSRSASSTYGRRKDQAAQREVVGRIRAHVAAPHDSYAAAPQGLDESGGLWIVEQDQVARAENSDQLQRVSLAHRLVGRLIGFARALRRRRASRAACCGFAW